MSTQLRYTQSTIARKPMYGGHLRTIHAHDQRHELPLGPFLIFFEDRILLIYRPIWGMGPSSMEREEAVRVRTDHRWVVGVGFGGE
jgi:hypothetical protein